MGFSLLDGNIVLEFLFPLWSPGLCGLWLNSGSPPEWIAELLVLCMVSDLSGCPCLSWVLVHSDEEVRQDGAQMVKGH